MTKHKKWIPFLIAGAAILVVASGATVAFAQATDNPAPRFPGSFPPVGPGQSWPDGSIDHDAVLAEALGITVDELQAAQSEAHTVVIEQAIEAGQITQEQADQMLDPNSVSKRGQRAFGKLGMFGSRGIVDHQTPLANALGITVEELHAAQEEAHAAAFEQAVEEGFITEEMVTKMETFRALRDYLETDDSLAEARATMKVAQEGAIQQAVEDGVIAQVQADQFLNGDGPGSRGPGMRDGRFSRFGHMAPGMAPPFPAP